MGPFRNEAVKVNWPRRICLFVLVSATLAETGLAQHTEDKNGWGYGYFFFSANGLFNLDQSTSDPALGFGGGLDVRLEERLSATFGAGFLGNIANNDAFDDHSGLLSPGIRFRPKKASNLYLIGGYTLAKGEDTTRNLGFGGVGYTSWYGDLIGWQVEVRDSFNSDLNFLEVRFAITLR